MTSGYTHNSIQEIVSGFRDSVMDKNLDHGKNPKLRVSSYFFTYDDALT